MTAHTPNEIQETLEQVDTNMKIRDQLIEQIQIHERQLEQIRSLQNVMRIAVGYINSGRPQIAADLLKAKLP